MCPFSHIARPDHMLTIDVSRRQVALLTPTIQYIMSICSSLSMLRFLAAAGAAPLLPLKGIRR